MPSITRFESNNGGEEYGTNVVEIHLKEILPKHRLTVQYKRTTTNKETKIYVASDNIIKNFWFRKDKAEKIGTQYYKFMQELTKYTHQGKNKHDDVPDSLAMLENLVGELNKPLGRVAFYSKRNLGF
jgi:predicted phage terminase large subunit-like protein